MKFLNFVCLFLFSSLIINLNGCSNLQDPFEKACHHIKKGEFSIAHKHLKALSKNKHSKAQTLMGLFHEKGIVVEKDINQAISYYRQAAGQGLPQAQSRLGHLLLATAGKDSEEAVLWLQRAAAQGEAEAQATLSKLGRLDKTGTITGTMSGAANSFNNGLHQGGAQYQSGMDNLTKSWVGYADIVNTLNQASAASSKK